MKRRRRAAWRRRLVEAERGIAQGLRGDSALFVHFFAVATVLAAGLVLGLEIWQWSLLLLAATIVVASELFCQVLRLLSQGMAHYDREMTTRADRLATAAVFVTVLGAFLLLVLIFGHRLWTILAAR